MLSTQTASINLNTRVVFYLFPAFALNLDKSKMSSKGKVIYRMWQTVCGKNARGKIAIGKNVRGKIAIGKNVRAKVVKIP